MMTKEEIKQIERRSYKKFLKWLFPYKKNPSDILEKLLLETETFEEAEASVNVHTCRTKDLSVLNEYWHLIGEYPNAN